MLMNVLMELLDVHKVAKTLWDPTLVAAEMGIVFTEMDIHAMVYRKLHTSTPAST